MRLKAKSVSADAKVETFSTVNERKSNSVFDLRNGMNCLNDEGENDMNKKRVFWGVVVLMLVVAVILAFEQLPEEPLQGVVASAELFALQMGEENANRFMGIAENKDVLTVDTDPYDLSWIDALVYDHIGDLKKASEELGMILVETFNETLGLADITEEMRNTTEADGVVKKTYLLKGVEISWRNSGDTGLEVIYKALY